MKLMDVSEIPGWPEDVLLAYSHKETESLPDILNEAEKSEYESFANENRKSEYLLGRGLFQFLLRELEINPKDVQLLKEEKGKPYAVLGDKLIHVSFTHSQKMVFCAISKTFQIGIDTESEKREIKKGVIKRILNEKEWQAVEQENPLKLWTIKEAALKCSGHGLQTNLRNLYIHKKNENGYFIRFNDDINYEICSFNALHHQITLAYQSIHS